jgi:ATP adenylyltransferase
VLVRGRLSYVILNLYPYNNGHLMVVPNRHLATLAETTADELAEMMAFTRDAEIALTEGYQPQGINVGINLGRPAGAGIVDHIHIHLVPRWTGDTNFMSVVGGTRVLPEDMQETVARLRPIFERLLNARSTQSALSTQS